MKPTKPRAKSGTSPAPRIPATTGQLKEQLHTGLFMDALAAAVAHMCERRPGTAFSAEMIALGLLHLVIERWPSLRSVYSRLTDGCIAGLAPVQASEAAFYDRLGHLPHQVMLSLLTGMAPSHKAERTLQRLKNWAPFATGFAAVDESTLDAVARKSVELRKHARANEVVLAGRIGCLIDLATRHIQRLVYEEDADANEKTHVEALLEGVAPGTMLVWDLGYFSFGLFDMLTERGIHFVSRLRKSTSFVVQQHLVMGSHYRDRIVLLGKHNSEKAAHPVRLVEIRVNGQWWNYITNVLDPRQLRADAVWALYGCRWSIEKVFTVVKCHLGMAQIHMTSLNGMLLQLWSTLVVYQILQDLRLEIAATHGWDDDDVSWVMLLRYISMYGEKDRAGQSLVDYLKVPRQRASLKKAGVRQRRLTELPAALMKEICGVAPARPIAVPPRKPRRRSWPKKSAGVVFAVPMG